MGLPATSVRQRLRPISHAVPSSSDRSGARGPARCWRASTAPECAQAFIQKIGGCVHESFSDQIDMALLPALELGSLHPLVEGSHGRSAMHLVVNPLILATLQCESHRVGEIPSEDERHLVPGIDRGGLS